MDRVSTGGAVIKWPVDAGGHRRGPWAENGGELRERVIEEVVRDLSRSVRLNFDREVVLVGDEAGGVAAGAGFFKALKAGSHWGTVTCIQSCHQPEGMGLGRLWAVTPMGGGVHSRAF